MPYLVEDLNKNCIREGNLPKYIDNGKHIYATKYGIGIITDNVISSGQCNIGDITFYIYMDGFLAEFQNTKTHQIRYMALGEEVLLYTPKKHSQKLTINQILSTMYRIKFDSLYVNAFKNAICDILAINFKLTKL